MADQRELRRHRSSTTKANALPRDVELDILTLLIRNVGEASMTQPIDADLDRLITLFTKPEEKSAVQDHFRRAHGLQALTRVLLSVESCISTISEHVSIIDEVVNRVCKTLRILSLALDHHTGNQRHFATRIQPNGWSLVERSSISSFILATGDSVEAGLVESLVTALISLAFEIDDYESSVQESTIQDGDPMSTSARQDLRLQNSEAISILALLYSEILHSRDRWQATATRVLKTISDVAHGPLPGRLALRPTATFRNLAERLIASAESSQIHEALYDLCNALLQNGTSRLADASWLLHQASSNISAQKLLSAASQCVAQPHSVTIDLARSGHAALELPSLPRPFPPSIGYTLAIWFRVNKFDPSCHTTIFGAFDLGQTCFVLVYLEKESHQLILQTSVRAPRPSVRFKKTVFQPHLWYHLVLVHKRDSSGESGQAELYLNGRFVERRGESLYPVPPTSVHGDTLKPSDHNTRRNSVQCFLGTPQHLADGRKDLQWSLASARLYDVCLTPEIIAVHHGIGPCYMGNFQDSIGQWFTYDASAKLNCFNDEVNRDRDKHLTLLKAIQQRGINALPESNVLIGIAASSVTTNDGFLGHSVKIHPLLPADASIRLQTLTRSGNAVAFNAARPALSDALLRSYGTVTLTGEVFVDYPPSLSDASWKLGGFLAVHVKLLDAASEPSTLLMAIDTIFSSIQNHWRASEAVEKDHGYGMIALLLRKKMGFGRALASGFVNRLSSVASTVAEQKQLEIKILRRVLAFVGYNLAEPSLSLLINPIAYRALLLDFGPWEMAGVEAQRLYYQQFTHFLEGNKHVVFNTRRFTRMRLIRHTLDSPKVETAYEENSATSLGAFETIFVACWSPKDHMDFAAFIVYALQNCGVTGKTKRRPTIKSSGSRQRSSSNQSASGFVVDYASISRVPLYEVGAKMLQIFASILTRQVSAPMSKRFIRDIPIKWLVFLFEQDDARVVDAAARITAQACVAADLDFKNRFMGVDAGHTAMKTHWSAHYRCPSVWISSFAIFFGKDVTRLQSVDKLTTTVLVDQFVHADSMVASPAVFPTIVALLTATLCHAISDISFAVDDRATSIELLVVVVDFLNEMYNQVSAFRQFADGPQYIEGLISVLYPAVTNTTRLKASVELSSELTVLNTLTDKPMMKSEANSPNSRSRILRSLSNVSLPERISSMAARATHRPLSVAITDAEGQASTEYQLAAHLSPILASSKDWLDEGNTVNSAVKSLLEHLVRLLVEQVCNKKDFTGLGVFQKVPPGHREHQSVFESRVLQLTMVRFWEHLQGSPLLLQSPKTLNNIAKYCLHMAEAVFEGWFIAGAQPLVDFAGKILDHLQQPDVARVKDVRLCSRAISTIRTVFLRITLLRLSELDESHQDADTLSFMRQLNYWQTILFSPENQELPFIRLICYVLYTKLISDSADIRSAAANLFRMLLVHKPSEAAAVLTQDAEADQRHLSTGLMRLATHDDEELLQWVAERRAELDKYLLDTLAKHWQDFVGNESQTTRVSVRNRLAKRRERLKQWQTDEAEDEYAQHQMSTAMRSWRYHAYESEKLKLQRMLQDRQESIIHMHGVIARLHDILRQPCGIDADTAAPKWQLDQTEGRDRMRMRLSRDRRPGLDSYRPKRQPSQRTMSDKDNLAPPLAPASPPRSISPAKNGVEQPRSLRLQTPGSGHDDEIMMQTNASSSSLLEGDFEIVDDPRDDGGRFEDKNRKVMRSLKRGDQIRHVFNMSRLVGLEACEGLLVIGKKCLYLQDGMFQRPDGEIVSMAQAPSEERDHYVQMISGREINVKRIAQGGEVDETRSWSWTEVLSLSKRRFLFRDVAIEVFFMDGRSYLMILLNPKLRDRVFAEMTNRAPHVHGPVTSPLEAEAWRLESLRVPEEAPQTFGSRFANVFSAMTPDTPTRKWMRGELSNFNYLMMVNTMAGRTFNDLTQYPVFPWVLADYTSHELDLTDPRSFRDLTKPMGCQNPTREAEFRERYRSFAEMGEEKPFHYGTHYSSAMIVTSYLIRLQPFVQSYLLLQGGAFDHADRLFDSIAKAWKSASLQNMSDVRELTPEFFYLPEFLTNINGYDFGQREGNSQAINHVELPPWAKNDPHVFIAKHREALESPLVSQNLHAWIDLIFGCKQSDQGALEATNVFHPLSYHGAKDLDTIDDPVERMATIGIIHNFGQTPQQVFHRPHAARETEMTASARLDTLATTLTKLPSPVAETRERACSLVYSTTLDRVLSCPSYRLHLPPNNRQYVQWLFADNSLRFYSTESKRLLNLYEELHIGPITTAVFADARTLITGGADSTLGIWDITSTAETVDLAPRTHLFGHRSPVTVLAASRALSIIVSASTDGQVITWDLNHDDCIRILRPASTDAIQAIKINNSTGRIMLVAGPTLLLYTLNGHLLLAQRVSDDGSDASDTSVTCCAFYEGAGNEYVERELIFTGHAKGVVKIWSLVTLRDGSWHLQLVKYLEQAEQIAFVNGATAAAAATGSHVPAVTSILPLAKKVYAGDEAGRIWQWDCVPRQGQK